MYFLFTDIYSVVYNQSIVPAVRLQICTETTKTTFRI